MNENKKTLAFVAVAACVVLAALISMPRQSTSPTDDLRGKLLFPDFKDPLSITSLEIVEYDEETATLQKFLVHQTEVKGKTRWTIPSHDNYPADAKEQVASAATSLMGLKILEVASEDQGDQKVYGVVEPDPKGLKIGSTGVGTKVMMRNKEGKDVLGLVIGKEVPDRTGLRYVRKLGQDQICVVEAATDKLSTKFENWIERNLLQISSFDVKQLWIRDYSIKPTMDGLAMLQSGEFKIAHSDGEPKWKMLSDQRFVRDDNSPSGGRWTPVTLQPNEELNTAKLDEMLTALDDLKIVDVSRKPAALSADLKKAKGFAKQGEAGWQELADKGFFLDRLNDGKAECYSNEGEVRIAAGDGCEYILRFGNIAGASSAKKEDKGKADAAAGKDPKSNVNRYLFVMAEFNPDMLPKPTFEPLPEIKKAEPKAEAKPAEKPAEQKSDASKPDAKKADDKKPADAPKSDAKQSDENKPDAVKKEADPKAADAAAEAAKKALDAERARIEKENKRKQEEYDQKIADGKKRVAELNARFADWYYIISDDVYRKIHLGRDEIIKKKDQPKGKGEQDAHGHDHGNHDHAGHDHGEEAPAKEPSTPMEDLDRLKQAGPAGK